MRGSAPVALAALVLGLLASPSGVLGQRGGVQTEGNGARSSNAGGSSRSIGGGGNSYGLGNSVGGGNTLGGGSSLGGSSLGGRNGGNSMGGSSQSGNGNMMGGNTQIDNSGGGINVGGGNGNGNIGGNNGNGNGNGNTIVTGGQGNQVGGQGNIMGNGNQVGGQGNQGGIGNVNQGGQGNQNQNQEGGMGNSQNQQNGPYGCWVNGIYRKDCAGGKSDPIMTGFAGRSFNFFGDIGKYYSLVTEANHQLSMHLKGAVLHDHNGTNMDRIGLQFKSYRVEMAINAAEEVTVAVNDRLLTPKNTLQTHAWRFTDGHMVEMSWELNRPGLGNTVRFTTDTLDITSWYVPAGIPEPGHEENILGSYLNFNITLLGPPVGNHMEGIIGETYERYTSGLAAISDPNNTRLYAANDGKWKGLHPIQQYEMANLWDTKFPIALFNSTEASAPRERSQLAIDAAFPVTARGCQHCAI